MHFTSGGCALDCRISKPANRIGAASGKNQNSETRPVEFATIAARCRTVVVKQQFRRGRNLTIIRPFLAAIYTRRSRSRRTRRYFPRYVCSPLATSYWNSQIARLECGRQGMFYRDQRYIEEAPWERHLYGNEALMRFPSSLGATSDMAMPLRRSLESFSEPQSIEMTLLIELANIFLIAEGYNIAPRRGWR